MTDVRRTGMWQRLRRAWAERLPYPCVHCGRPVLPDPPGAATGWHLAHVTALADGGDPWDARPAHKRCNLADGGRIGLRQMLGSRRDAGRPRVEYATEAARRWAAAQRGEIEP